jgi:hypothetical protein
VFGNEFSEGGRVSQFPAEVSPDVTLGAILEAISLEKEIYSGDRWLLGFRVKYPSFTRFAVNNE